MIGKKINQLATELAPVSTDLTIIGDPISGVSKKITLAQLGAIFSGAVSFYTNLAGFPATGDINVIYCAKDTQKLYLWSGSAYVEVFPSQALLDNYQLRSEKGVSNGYASLDSTGKVPISQLPSSIMEYKGTWNASTNTPTLANGTGDTGDVYICNVAGTVNFGAGPITFAVGDYVIYSGSIWQRSSGAVGTVTSVAASITGNAIGITGSPVTTSGTLAFAFAGTGAQYIKGDGTLATFPSTIAQAERLITEVYNSTGATLTKGTIVYINGGQGNLPTVTKALATGDSTSAQTFGVVQADITNNNNGYVVVAGKLSDLDTQAYTEGTQLYLSSTTAGTWTSTKQYAPAHLVYVGIVVRAHPTQGIVEIKIQNGYELDELHNVAAQSPTNNDGIFYNSATSLWEKKSIATVLGYTPQAQLNGTGFVKASGTTISYDNSTYVTTDTNQTITGIKTFNNITNFNQNIVGGLIKLSQGVLLSKSANIGTDPGHITLLAQGITGTNYIYFADGDNFLNTQRFAIPTTGTYTYTLQAASGTLAFTSDLTGGTVTSVGLSSATSGVTIGSTPITTSGTITLAIATASGSQQGLLSSTDWTTFNNKQNALTNPVTGTGTTNYLPKFTGTSTIGNSIVSDNGSRILINTGTTNQNTTINASKIAMSRTSDGAEVVYFSKNTDLGTEGTANINGYDGIQFRTQGAESVKATLNASGNLGLGVTPSDWSGAGNVFELGSVAGNIAGASTYLNITSNAYYNAGYKYKTTAAAAYYAQDNGKHIWNTAPSGTAGNAISFTQAMTLNASGNLSIGNTNDTYRLDVTGRGRFTHTGGVPALDIRASDSNFALMSVFGNQTGDVNWLIMSGYPAAGDFTIRQSDTVNALTLAKTTGAATFSSTIEAARYLANSSSASLVAFGVSAGNGMYNAGADTVAFSTASTERMRLTTTGLGIGTTSPTDKFNVVVGSNGNNTRLDGPTSGLIFQTNATTVDIISYGGTTPAYRTLNFSASASTNMTITTAGNVGIGTTSPSGLFEVKGGSIILNSTSAGNHVFSFALNGTEVGQIYHGSDNINFYAGTSNYLRFSAGSAERMRITSGGDLIIGATSTSSPSIYISPDSGGGALYKNTNSTNSRTAAYFQINGTTVGTISTSGSSTTYATSSDYRLKTDYKDFSGLDLVSKIKAYDYEWKSDKSRSYGVIAHELQSVINYAVTGVKDGEQMQGVDYSKIVPVLIKAIQEQQQQIEQLKNK